MSRTPTHRMLALAALFILAGVCRPGAEPTPPAVPPTPLVGEVIEAPPVSDPLAPLDETVPAPRPAPARPARSAHHPAPANTVHAAESHPIYLAYNVWFEKMEHVYSVNYKKGRILPAGTEIASYTINDDDNDKAISFTTAKGNRFTIEFQARFHGGMTAREFAARLFTPKPFEQLVQGLTRSEIDGIRKGIVKVGMSKRAVLITYGYPPEHVTPSTRADVWYYWSNRIIRRPIYFNEDGQAIRDPKRDPDEL